MIIRKKEIVLQDQDGQENKQWLIRYYILNKHGEPVRIYENVKKSLNKEERYAFAKERIAYLSQFQDEKGHVLLPEVVKEVKEKKDNSLYFILKEAMKSKLATISPRSSYTYKPALFHFKNFFGEKLPPAQFERSKGYLFRNYLLDKQLAKKTVNGYMSVIRELIAEAGRIGLLPESYNPMNNISMLPAVMKAQEIFVNEHFTEIYNYCYERDKILFKFIMFMFYTCNRPDALRLLKIEDIDLAGRKIRFVAENQKTAVRKFQPISDAFLEELNKMGFDKYPKNWYVFGHHGEPSSQNVGFNFFSKRHRAMLKALNLQVYGYKMYAWKHTGAVYLYNSLRDIKRVSEHLFHTDIKTTLVYLQRYGVIFGDGEFEKKAPRFGV